MLKPGKLYRTRYDKNIFDTEFKYIGFIKGRTVVCYLSETIVGHSYFLVTDGRIVVASPMFFEEVIE